MKLKFLITTEVSKVSGSAATREEIIEELRQHLEDDSNPEVIWPAGEGEYKITTWDVTEA